MTESVLKLKNMFREAYRRCVNEDQDRLRRVDDKYGETEFEESADSMMKEEDTNFDSLEQLLSGVPASRISTNGMIDFEKIKSLAKPTSSFKTEATPPDTEKFVKSLKKDKDVENTLALANYIKNKKQ